MKSRLGSRYYVLTASMWPEGLRERLEVEMKTLKTPTEATNYVVTANEKDPGWSHAWPSPKLLVISYKGVEIAAFYKRQWTQMAPDSEGVLADVAVGEILQDLDDAWIRVSLLNAESAKTQAEFFIGDYNKAISEREQYRRLVESQRREIEMLNEKILSLELTSGR